MDITIGRTTAATITGLTMGTAGTAITTATTEITTIGGNKLTYLEIQIELAREQFRASFFLGAAGMKIDDRPLLLWLGRLYGFCRRTLGWLVDLKLFFQLLN